MLTVPSETYMREAIRQAYSALETGEGMGFGAVIERNGKVIAAAHNSVRATKDPTAHAEIQAIRAACEIFESTNLNDCTLYTTCEPCPMCFTACWWAGISQIVFGVRLEDVTGVSEEMLVPVEYLNEKGESRITLEGSFMREECLNLYRVE